MTLAAIVVSAAYLLLDKYLPLLVEHGWPRISLRAGHRFRTDP